MNSIVGVVDHGVGNSVAIFNLLRKIGVPSVKVSSPEDFSKIEENNGRLILPGVGSFDPGMNALDNQNLTEKIKDFASEGGFLLGICLGMHLLFEGSDEGSTPGLGILPGRISKIVAKADFKVPHVGWSYVKPSSSNPIISGIDVLRFYHNHSFALISPNKFEFCSIDYSQQYAVGVRHENVVGIQFHPEKSHSAGEQLIRNFLSL